MHGKNNVFQKRLFFFLAAVFFAIFIFQDSFTSYFFQDDWFSLSISKAGSVRDFLSFFKPRAELIYYRPLGMQLPFFIFQLLFGLSPLPFRIATLALHIVNGYLVYKIFRLIFRKREWGSVISFLYLTSAVHFTPFFWAATIAFVLAPTFFFAGFYLYLRGSVKLSFAMFLIGLFTNELLVTLPIVVLAWEVLHTRKIKVQKVFPFFLISAVYGLYRLTLAKIPSDSAYALSLGVRQLVVNLRDYMLWTINWPEEVHNQFISFVTLSPVFVRQFSSFVATFLFVLLSVLTFFVIVPILFLFKNKNVHIPMNSLVFGVIWFFVTLSPVFFFSQHLFSYYLPIPIIGMFFSLFSLFEVVPQVIKKHQYMYIILGIFLVSWVTSSIANARFNKDIHWAPRRAKNSQKLILEVKNMHETISSNATILVPKSDENVWALGDQNALQVIYNDPTVITIYGK